MVWGKKALMHVWKFGSVCVSVCVKMVKEKEPNIQGTVESTNANLVILKTQHEYLNSYLVTFLYL